MNHFEWSWTQQGIKFYAQGWNPPQTKAVVCLVHGFNEHSTRYRHVAERFCNAGYALLTFDEFGHGRTEGKRGHAPSYDAMLDSIKIILQEANTRFPNIPVFLYGHSMGGAEVINYITTRPNTIKGAIATSPLLRLAFEPPAIKVFLAWIMKSIFPGYSEKANLDADAISRDKEEVRRYIADPLNHGKITVGLFWAIREAGKRALAGAKDLKTPLLLMHGTGDRLTSAEASTQFAQNAPEHFITFKTWEGFYHELHNEPEPDRTEVINYIIKWLDIHL